MSPLSPASCPGCSHPFEATESEGNASGEPLLTHDVTSDGKLWCSVCEGECPWIRGLQDKLGRMLAAYSSLRAGGHPAYVQAAALNLEQAFLFATGAP